MLKVYYGFTKGEVNPDNWFKNVFNKKLLLTDFSKRLIEGTSDCVVVDTLCLKSKILGYIPPERIGSGVKAILYLMYEENKERYGIIHTRWLGDNMLPYLKYVANMKDIRVNTTRCFPFFLAEGEYNGVIEVLNTGKCFDNDYDFHEELAYVEAIENGWEV